MKPTRKQQTGASFFSILIVLLVAGFFFSVAFKLYPAYLDYNTVDSVLTQVSTDRDELQKSIGNPFCLDSIASNMGIASELT